MNIVVIGLGSMGKRRIRLLKEMYPENTVIGVARNEQKRREAAELFGITCCASIHEIANADCAFVCTSPLSHAEIITSCLERGWHVFTELNLVPDGYDKNMALAKEKHCALFLSSTFFYREEQNYISSRITEEKKWNYIYHTGQYLPDWHPWENYKDYFVGDKRTNGCREILAIELPWITGAFGEIESAKAVSDKMTNLAIGFHDNYMVQIRHKNGNKGILVVDVVSPVAVRKLEAYAENRYLSWNGTPESIQEYDVQTHQLVPVALKEAAEHEAGYSKIIVENAYKNEIKAFFDMVLYHKAPPYGFELDKITLKIIDSLGA